MLRRLLFSLLGFQDYLTVLSWGYFLSFNLGLLKTDPLYRYPYLVREMVGKGDVVVDVGANLGYFTRVFADLVGDRGLVYAVEPVEPIVSVLKRNVKRYNNVVILPYALGDEEKVISIGGRLSRTRIIHSGSHVVLDELGLTSEEADYTFQAEMKRGSSLFADLDRLDFLKCDIEGFEIIVLNEMIEVIRRHKPMLLVEAKNANRAAIVDLLYPLEYVGLEFDDERLVIVGDRQSSRYGDLLFVTEKTYGRIPARRRAHIRNIEFPSKSVPDMSPSRLGTPI